MGQGFGLQQSVVGNEPVVGNWNLGSEKGEREREGDV